MMMKGAQRRIESTFFMSEITDIFEKSNGWSARTGPMTLLAGALFDYSDLQDPETEDSRKTRDARLSANKSHSRR